MKDRVQHRHLGMITYGNKERRPNMHSQIIQGLTSLSIISPKTPTKICCVSLYRKPDLEVCKTSVGMCVKHMLLQRLSPTAMCSSQSFKKSIENNVSQTIGNMEDDCLPGQTSSREKIVQQKDMKQISEIEVNQWLETETGMDRVQMMYATRADGTFVQEDTQNLQTMFRRTVIGGVIANVWIASAQTSDKKEKHIATSQAAGKSMMNDRETLKKITKQSLKDSLRFAFCAASIFHLSQAIAAYRNKSSVWEYTVSSALGFLGLGVGHSLKKCAQLTCAGAALGTVGGFIVCSILANNGYSQEQRHIERIRQHLQDQKMK